MMSPLALLSLASLISHTHSIDRSLFLMNEAGGKHIHFTLIYDSLKDLWIRAWVLPPPVVIDPSPPYHPSQNDPPAPVGPLLTSPLAQSFSTLAATLMSSNPFNFASLYPSAPEAPSAFPKPNSNLPAQASQAGVKTPSPSQVQTPPPPKPAPVVVKPPVPAAAAQPIKPPSTPPSNVEVKPQILPLPNPKPSAPVATQPPTKAQTPTVAPPASTASLPVVKAPVKLSSNAQDDLQPIPQAPVKTVPKDEPTLPAVDHKPAPPAFIPLPPVDPGVVVSLPSASQKAEAESYLKNPNFLTLLANTQAKEESEEEQLRRYFYGRGDPSALKDAGIYVSNKDRLAIQILKPTKGKSLEDLVNLTDGANPNPSS